MSDLWGLHIAGNPTYDDFMQSVNTRPTGPQTLHRGVGLLKDYLDPDLHERLHRAVTTGQPDPDLIHHVLHHVDREGQGMGEYWSALPEDATSYSLTAALPGQDMTQPGYMIRKAPADYHVLISSDWDGQGGQVAHPDQDDNVYKLNPGSGLKVRSVKVRRGGRSGKDWSDWVDLGGDTADGIRYAHIVEADVADDLMRLAMPQPMPKDITFHYHPTNATIGTEPYIPDPTVEVPKFMAPAVEARHHGQTVGYLEWEPPLHATNVNGIQYGDHPPEVSMIKVHPDYRRHGIATALFDFARQHQGDLEHSDWRSDLGNKWVDYEQGRKTAMPNPLPEGIEFKYHPDYPYDLYGHLRGPTAYAVKDYDQIGYVTWHPDGEVKMIDVNPDYRRHGIGTALFDFAKQHEPNLHHSPHKSDLGEAWSAYEKSRNARLAAHPQRPTNWGPDGDWQPRDEGDGMMTLYHRTSPENADEIVKGQKFLPGKKYYPHEPDKWQYPPDLDTTWFATSPEGRTTGGYDERGYEKYGPAIVKVRVPKEKVYYPGEWYGVKPGDDVHAYVYPEDLDGLPIIRHAGANGPLPPLTFEPFNTMWSNGIMARHAEDGRPVGHLHWVPRGEIDSITVHPELQRRGIGTAMLEHARSNPDQYRSTYPIFHSQHLTKAGRAWAAKDGHDLPDEQVYEADENPANWGFTAVDSYVPLSQRYNGQNEDEMSRHLEQPWTPPHTASVSGDDGWPVWWRGKHRPAGDFDDRWAPNHPQHIPAPWDS